MSDFEVSSQGGGTKAKFVSVPKPHFEFEHLGKLKSFSLYNISGNSTNGYVLEFLTGEKFLVAQSDSKIIDENMPQLQASLQKAQKNGAMVVVGIIAVLAFLGLGFCGKAPPPANSTDVATNTTAPAAKEIPYEPPPPPAPHYSEKEGNKYLYSSQVSDMDRAQGKAVGNILAFEYLGKNSEGLYRLKSDGMPGAIISCTNPCQIIKISLNGEIIERIPYDERTVIGMAFDDAFNGNLSPANAK